MKKISLVLALIGALFFNKGYTQTYETGNYVRINSDKVITKTTTVKNCPDTIEKGSTIVVVYEKKKNNNIYTITKMDSLITDSTYQFEKRIKEKLILPGKANILVDDKDPSIIHVNYWLNGTQKVDSGTKVVIISRELQCDGKYKETPKEYPLKHDTTFYLWRVNTTETAELKSDWFKASDVKIEVYGKDSKIAYYLVNKYDREADYTMTMANREWISLKKRGFEFGPITIPFKYRFGYSKVVNSQNVDVDDDVIADINIGLFAGYKIGRYRARYETGKLVDLSNLGCTIGGFLSLSSASLDTNTTTAGVTPLKKDEKATIGVISPGIAIMFTVYNVQIGIFAGMDFGFGMNGRNWNYNGRPWIGFGIGYSVSNFWKK